MDRYLKIVDWARSRYTKNGTLVISTGRLIDGKAGQKDEAEMFRVPVGGVHDVSALGADALGVNVSEALNVARV